MKKRRGFLLPLAKQLFIILIFFVICTMGIILLCTYEYTNLQLDHLNGSLESYSAQLAKSTIESYDNYENICYSVAYSQTVQDYLTQNKEQDRYDNYNTLHKQLDNTSRLNSYIVDIAVLGDHREFASLYGSISNYEGFAQALSQSRFSYCSAGTAVINQTTCHILAMPVYSLGSGGSSYLGMLFLAIDIDSLFSNYLLSDDNNYHPQVLFTDSQGGLIYGDTDLYSSLYTTSAQTQTAAADTISKGTDSHYMVSSYSIPSIGHHMHILINKEEQLRQIYRVSNTLCFSMGMIILLGSLLIGLLYQPLIASLKQLTQFMKDITDGNLKAQRQGANIQQGILGSTEIHQITEALNDMLYHTSQLNHTIFDTYTRMYELEANNRRTEIAFLRSQVNPHFLYNTLTMICGMAAEGSTDKIISVAGSLSQIFRYSIKGSDMVTLREEMEIVQSYLMIQNERFGDRFTIRYAFEDNCMDFMIPKMVIQPLVENAIVHGLEKSLKPGSLLIGAGRNPQHGYLAIWIYDTGVGMPKEKLESLRKALSPEHWKQRHSFSENPEHAEAEGYNSIGILNVNSRMILYFGNDYNLLLDSEEGVGTNVQIRVPYQS